MVFEEDMKILKSLPLPNKLKVFFCQFCSFLFKSYLKLQNLVLNSFRIQRF